MQTQSAGRETTTLTNEKAARSHRAYTSKIALKAILLILGLAISQPAAFADSDNYNDYVRRLRDIKHDTDKNLLDDKGEELAREAAKDQYNKREQKNGVKANAFDFVNGIWDSFYTPKDFGTTVDLTFSYVDINTGALVPPPNPISRVEYFAYYVDGQSNPTFVGQSTDGASNFEVPFVEPGFESVIIAEPFDQFGKAYPKDGNWGAMMQVLVTPEPSSLLLLGSSVLGFSGFLRKRILKT